MNSRAKAKSTQHSCDWGKRPQTAVKNRLANTTRSYKHRGNFTWTGIRTEIYKTAADDWSDIIKRTLIGNHGESARFHVRYFEIAPGGFSSFERHKHEHVVIGIRGKGICIAGKKRYSIGFLDTIYIKPGDQHQLRNSADQPFGFLCIVNARRDRPKIIRAYKDK